MTIVAAPPLARRLKNLAHRCVDPLLAWPDTRRNRLLLRDLPDGTVRVPVEVPYVPQFASPDLIHDYIHAGLHGRDDPAWASFGAPDADTYDFWARRVCALACLKMAAGAFSATPLPTLWQLVEAGLAYGGYQAYDESGRLVDNGWLPHAIRRLAHDHGLQTLARSYVSVLEICHLVHAGWLVVPTVTPELGEYSPLRRPGPLLRYGGHNVLVYGFIWRAGRCEHLLLHNPSGRVAALQAGASIPAARFRRAFAHRLLAFRPAADSR